MSGSAGGKVLGMLAAAVLAGPAIATPAPMPIQAQAPAPPVPLPPAALQIDDTERAFAQAVAQSGIAPGFRQFAAPDAVMFLPDPTPAQSALATARWPGELLWRARYVAVAPSGDLAFSAGPSLLRGAGRSSGGFYLTIWRRQPDGSWRFVLDQGADMPAAIWDAPPRPLVALTVDPPAGAPSNEGMREADGALNAALPKGAAGAFAGRLDDQAILVRAMRPVATGAAVGVVLCAAVSRVLAGLLFGVSPHDAVTFTAVPVLLVGIALLAAWLPARRAMGVDPAVTLREN